MENNIIIYQTEDGQTGIDVRIEKDTVWLTQKQMAELFDKNVKTVNEHIGNIFKEGELVKDSAIRNFRITAADGKSYDTIHYNLDVAISVGYRVKSKRGTQFRIWATNTLRKYLVDGYALNEKRLQEKTQQIKELQNSIGLLNRCIENQAKDLDQAMVLSNLMAEFSVGLTLLDDFDNQRLDNKGKTNAEAVKISTQEFLEVVEKMKPEFGSSIFANPKDDSFDSSVNQIYQSIGGEDCYPTLEEKAAMLLYFVVKNHSFSDGNKRIGANCFLYFMQQNKMLYKNDKAIIDNATLAAITLLIAESKPAERETVVKIVISILNRS
ncbi:MAG: virulence protein RhuM/Fic/DOC family protein [Alphaproteobacteria bacterium]